MVQEKGEQVSTIWYGTRTRGIGEAQQVRKRSQVRAEKKGDSGDGKGGEGGANRPSG